MIAYFKLQNQKYKQLNKKYFYIKQEKKPQGPLTFVNKKKDDESQ